MLNLIMSNNDSVNFRVAVMYDLSEIVSLLADDDLGRTREILSRNVQEEYLLAFKEIECDPNNEIIVGVKENQVVAVLQLTYIPNLTLKGSKRALIEGVRVSTKFRGQGMGRLLFNYALDRARSRGCKLAQLTTNKERPDAIRFYETLGFKSSHEGMKLTL